MNGNNTTGGDVNAMYIHQDVSNIIVQNNILKVTQQGTRSIGMMCIPTTNPFADIDYNVYNISTSGTNVIGSFGGDRTTLSDWQAAISDEANSVSTTVTLKSNSDLHLDGASVGNSALFCPVATGADGSSINTDFDNEARNSDNNVRGADVVTPRIAISQNINTYSQTFCKGESATFSFTGQVTGFVDGISRSISSMPFTYKFYENDQLITPDGINYSQNNNTLTVIKLPAGPTVRYNGVVSLLGGSATSNTSTVQVQSPIVITANPSGAEACVGDESILLTFTAEGTITGYQWQRLDNGVWTNLPGKTQHDLFIVLDPNAIGGMYRVKITGPGICPRNDQNASNVYSQPVQVVIHHPLSNPRLVYDIVPGNICFGEDIRLSATANGTIVGYQWQIMEGGVYKDIDVYQNPTAKEQTLVIQDATEQNNGKYRCIVFGSTKCNTPFGYTESVDVKVWRLFEIISHPKPNILACQGDEIMLYVSVEGTVIENDQYHPAYQWYRDGKPIKLVDNPTANSSIFIIDDTKFDHSGAYHCEIFREDCRGRGFTSSNKSIIYILSETVITQQPKNRSAAIGGKATFEVKAHVQGAPEDYPISVQWYKGTKPGVPLNDDGKYIQGARSSMLSINNVQNSHYSNLYYAVVTGLCGTAETEYVALTEKPVIDLLTEPQDAEVCLGHDVEFTVEAEVSQSGYTLKYQWRKNGVDLNNDAHIDGVNTPMLKINNMSVTDIGSYDCFVWIDGEPDINVTSNAEIGRAHV